MKKVLKVIVNVIVWIFVVFALVTVILAFSAQANSNGVPSLFGKNLICVQSDSMKPTFEKGDLIMDDTISLNEQANCKKGDIITFKTDLDGDGYEEFNTHRVVKKYIENNMTYYETKGDYNLAKDSNAVPYNMVIGKYNGTKISNVGSVIDFLQTSTGFLCVIVIPLALFFIYELYVFIKAVMARNQEKNSVDEEELKKQAVEEYLKQQQSLKETSANEESHEAQNVQAEKGTDEKNDNSADE